MIQLKVDTRKLNGSILAASALNLWDCTPVGYMLRVLYSRSLTRFGLAVVGVTAIRRDLRLQSLDVIAEYS